MPTYHQVETAEDTDHVRQLFLEYTNLVHAMIHDELGFNFDVDAKVDEDMAKLEVFLQPPGRLLLAVEDS
jgi:hypothetical protein